MMKKALLLLLMLLVLIGVTGCSTLAMPSPQQFGSFGVIGENAQRHSCMALVLAITKQRGWVLRDVATGCGVVKARASSGRGDFSVDFVFVINSRGVVTVDVEQPRYTSSNGRSAVVRWINLIEGTYSRYRARSYSDLEGYVGRLCVP